MLTVTLNNGSARFRSSTGHDPPFRCSRPPKTKAKRSGHGLRTALIEGVMPHEMGVFVRSPAELDRARAAVEHAGLPFKVLDEHVETTSAHVSISTMHLAKGLEFRAVVCDGL